MGGVIGKTMIKGNKVFLRPAREQDFPLLYKWVNNPTVVRFWYGRDKPRSMDWITKHFKPIIKGKSNSTCWIIEIGSKPIGFMYSTVDKNDDKEFTGRVEVDILIGEDKEWEKGYGTDALKAMIKYAFQIQKAERVFIMPRISNTRAIHVYEKAGFKKEGILRRFEKFEGEWIDCVMMAIIKDEFRDN